MVLDDIAAVTSSHLESASAELRIFSQQLAQDYSDGFRTKKYLDTTTDARVQQYIGNWSSIMPQTFWSHSMSFNDRRKLQWTDSTCNFYGMWQWIFLVSKLWSKTCTLSRMVQVCSVPSGLQSSPLLSRDCCRDQSSLQLKCRWSHHQQECNPLLACICQKELQPFHILLPIFFWYVNRAATNHCCHCSTRLLLPSPRSTSARCFD